MKFYRALSPFKVISFDLDDTLYDNRDTIRNAENHFLDCLRKQALLPDFSNENWYARKQQFAEKHPLIAEDVLAWREQTLQQWLSEYNIMQADGMISGLMAEFIEWRHKIDVPMQTFRVLDVLQQRYPLSIISNGNVIAKRLGLNHFQLSLRGGEQGRAKPHRELFQQTADYFGVKPHEILHVGDNLLTDVQGAIAADAQAVWINLSGKGIQAFPEARLLPTLEINNLTELLQL